MIFKKTRPEQQAIPELEPLLEKKAKKPRQRLRKKDRYLVIGLFGFTVLLSLIFYLKAEFPGFWEKVAAPLIISSGELPQTKFDPTPVLDQIKLLTQDLRGIYGVYVYQLGTDHQYGLNQEQVFPAASLMKLPVMITAYQQQEAGKLDLKTEYQLQQKDIRGGAGILQNKALGSSYSYRQLAEYMAQYSDNTANQVLTQILGVEKIQQTIDSIGMSNTSFKDYTTTPQDMGLLFRKLYQTEALDQESSQEILEFLTQTAFEERIPAGIPEGTRVAHKIGTEIGVYSDVGIVFAKPPFILVILTEAIRESEAKEVLPQITTTIWEFEGR